MPTPSIIPVRRPAQEETNAVPTYPRRDGHQLRLDRCVPQSGHNGRREEGQAAQRDAVGQVGEVMAEHAWAGDRGEDFVPRGVRFGVPAALDFDAVFDVALVVFGEPAGAGRVVGQEEEDGQDGEDGDDAFDDEQPAEAW